MLSWQRGDESSVYKLFPAVDKTVVTVCLPCPDLYAVSAARFRGKELLLFFQLGRPVLLLGFAGAHEELIKFNVIYQFSGAELGFT